LHYFQSLVSCKFGSCRLCVFWPFFGLPFLSPLWWFQPLIFYWIFVVFFMKISNKEDDSLTIGIAQIFHHYGCTLMFLCELFPNLAIKENMFLLNIILIFFLCFSFSSLEWCCEWFLCEMCKTNINLYNLT
jgi:hypothetical protein